GFYASIPEAIGDMNLGGSYLCTFWTETKLSYAKLGNNRIGKLETEEINAYNVELKRYWIKKTYRYDVSDRQTVTVLISDNGTPDDPEDDIYETVPMSLDSFRGRPTGWTQEGKGDSICASFGLDEKGYTGIQVDVYYDPASGRITRQDGTGGVGFMEQVVWVPYYTVEDGTTDDPSVRSQALEDLINNYKANAGNVYGDFQVVLPQGDLEFQQVYIPAVTQTDEYGNTVVVTPGHTDYQLRVIQKTKTRNLGDALDQANLTYDFMGRVIGGTFTSWDKDNNKFVTVTKWNIHYWSNGNIRGWDEQSLSKENKLVTTHIRDTAYDSHGQEVSHYTSGETRDKKNRRVTFVG
ncbi:MAG: hypothetical protein AAB267_02030, partial [Candidatus Desantisbacteria bacterium]